jgi:plasmid stabilization system protein ParE
VTVELTPPASHELKGAIRYYNGESEGLGDEFQTEVDHTIERILEFPEAGTPLSRRTRRCLTRRFPYAVIYQVRGETLWVVAVMHLHRDPRSWQDRLPRDQR